MLMQSSHNSTSSFIHISGKIPIFKTVMEIDTIPDFTVFPEDMILKMIPDSQIQDTKIHETFQNIIVTVKNYHKTVMIPNIVITNGSQIGKGIEFGTRTTILDGTLTILPFPEFWEVGCRNYKVTT